MRQAVAASDDPGDGRELFLRFGGPFPWHGTYQGEPVVMIAVEEYRALLADIPVHARPRRERRPLARRMRVTRWERDPDLAAFVRDRLGRMQQKEIRAETVQRFGEARAPTRSALSRFAIQWRLENGLPIYGGRKS